MEVINAVLGADRDRAGRITKLLIGVAEAKTRNWLKQPEPMSADFVVRCIQAGQVFRVYFAGYAGPLLAVGRDPAGEVIIVAAEGPALDPLVTLDDLPPFST